MDDNDFPVNSATPAAPESPLASAASPPHNDATSDTSSRPSRRHHKKRKHKGPREGETEEQYKERRRKRREARKRKKEELLKKGVLRDDAAAETPQSPPERRRRPKPQQPSLSDHQPEPPTRHKKRLERPSQISIPPPDAAMESQMVVEHDEEEAAAERRRKRREKRRKRELRKASEESNTTDMLSPDSRAKQRHRQLQNQTQGIMSSPSDENRQVPQQQPPMTATPGGDLLNAPFSAETSVNPLDAPITKDDFRQNSNRNRFSRSRKKQRVTLIDNNEQQLDDDDDDDQDNAQLAASAMDVPDEEEEGEAMWGTSVMGGHHDEKQSSSVDGEDDSDGQPEGETRIRNATTEDILQPMDTEEGLLSTTKKLDNMLHFFSFTNPRAKPPQRSQKHSKFTEQVEHRLTREFRKAVLNLTVHKCDILRLNNDVIHPVVRITIFDCQTGTLLPKHDSSRSAVFSKEYVGGDPNCEYILPIMIKPYDMRRMKSLIPHWESSLFFDQDYDYFLNPNVVFFFEILDFDTKDPVNYSSTEGLKKIAWAYLHPLSESGRSNTEKRIRLQLYHYPNTLLQKILPNFLKRSNRSSAGSNAPSADMTRYFPYTEAMNLYNSKTKKKYPSTLHVTLSAFERPIKEQVTHRPEHQLQIESGSLSYEEMSRMYGSNWHLEEENLEQVFNEKENRKLNRIMSNLKRVEKEKCKIPDHLMFQFESGTNGCLAVAFSHNNEFIACACSNLNSTSTIKVYHVFTGKLAAEYEGHLSSLVYDVDWNQSDNLLCSASADSTVRVWNFGKKKQQLFNIQHPSFVYAAKFHPTFSTYMRGTNLQVDHLLVTGSYDQKIRFFVLSSQAEFQPVIIKEVDTLHSARINSLAFDPNGLRLFSGDGSGVINVLSARVDTISKSGGAMQPNETKDDSQNNSRRSSQSSASAAAINGGTPLRGYTTDMSRLEDSINSATREQLVAWKRSDTLFTCIRTVKERDISRATLTSLRVDPRHAENRLIVHSQDNLIRLLDLNSNVVLRRYSGVKCHMNAQKSQVSPDGRYVITGSDTGKIFIWYKDSEKMLFPEGLDFGFMNHSVYDIAWASDYHIIALCSYGSPEPVRIFTIGQEDEDQEAAPAEKDSLQTGASNIAKKFLGTFSGMGVPGIGNLGGTGRSGSGMATLLKVPLPNVIPKSPRRSPRGPAGEDSLRSPSAGGSSSESLKVG